MNRICRSGRFMKRSEGIWPCILTPGFKFISSEETESGKLLWIQTSIRMALVYELTFGESIFVNGLADPCQACT